MTTEKNTEIEDRVSAVKISDIFFITLRKWPWILLSVLICVGIAVTYVLCTPPTYTRSASIVIKDDSKGKSLSSELDAFSDMGLVTSNSNIIDEVNKLKSRNVIKDVIKRLNLDVSYFKDGKFHDDLIYGPQLPIKVSFPGALESDHIYMTVDVMPDGKFSIIDLTRNGDDVKVAHDKSLPLGTAINSPAGKIIVEKTPYWQPGTDITIHIVKAPMKGVVTNFSRRLDVKQESDKGNTVSLMFTDRSTQRAEDFINGVINIYNEKWLENRNQICVSTSNFINERLGVIESELGNVDQDISTYQSAHLIPDVEQAASMYMNESQQATSQLLDLNNQLQMTRHLRNYLAASDSKEKLLPTNIGIENPSIEAQIKEYNEAMLMRNEYSANSSSTHPRVVELDSKLSGMRTAILATLDNQIISLDTRIRSLQASKNATTAQIAANPTQAKYLLSVERQQKVKESLYLFLLQKREENELSQAFTAYNTQIITSPDGEDMPTSPKTQQIILVAFLIGLVIPFGVTYLKEINNTKVRGKQDLEDIPVPLLGEIPLYKPKKGSEPEKNNIVVKPGKRNVINEAFRVLRTNVSFMSGKDQGCSVIMITSFNPGSGKSFISINLGISLAIKGKRVLIIDGDMRHGSTSSFIGSPKKGMSNYLVGETNDINSVIVKDTLADGLSVLPVGTIPPNPTELLESERFTNLIAKLREDYDYIFIDCPPVEMMADAQIIETVADRTIFIIRAGLLERSMLPELERMIEQKKFKNLSLVLNSTVANNHRYGYKYGYGYGYGDYNHYNSDND